VGKQLHYVYCHRILRVIRILSPDYEEAEYLVPERVMVPTGR
jgi:hypothetical protein